jgi:uncharacterized protein YggU (UPF0235/DUF167 family)
VEPSLLTAVGQSDKAMPLIFNNDYFTVNIKACPGAKTVGLGEIVEDSNNCKFIKFYLHTQPTDGKANKDLIAILAKLLQIPKSNITIFKGHKDRYKSLSIMNNGVSKERVMSLLKI